MPSPNETRLEPGSEVSDDSADEEPDDDIDERALRGGAPVSPTLLAMAWRAAEVDTTYVYPGENPVLQESGSVTDVNELLLGVLAARSFAKLARRAAAEDARLEPPVSEEEEFEKLPPPRAARRQFASLFN
ncbi:hypothetical protein HDU90_004184 [Geranomyces variabilis]|nr:hypothetical protein HDU90_004184 [Geranomyces variabilis]